MTELGKNIGEWLGRGLVETTEDLVEAFDATAGAPAEKQHAGVDATRPCAPPKASASWFGKASKHCNRCGKASVKVERPACKGCGSTEWNFEGVVDSSEQGFLARAQANATSRAKMMNTMEGSDEPGDQVVAGDVSEALSALNALFQRRELDSAGMGRAYELRGVHLGAGARCLRLATHCAVEMRVHARAHTHTHTVTHTHTLTHSLAHSRTHSPLPTSLPLARSRALSHCPPTAGVASGRSRDDLFVGFLHWSQRVQDRAEKRWNVSKVCARESVRACMHAYGCARSMHTRLCVRAHVQPLSTRRPRTLFHSSFQCVVRAESFTCSARASQHPCQALSQHQTN